MRKIPTLFVRRADNPKLVTGIVTPGCEWVIDGEGVPTRKLDGTCVMFDTLEWWARRELKPDKPIPDGFLEVEHDPVTGKTVGWVPAVSSGFWRYLDEAIEHHPGTPRHGTYELVGPKINGNPEGSPVHQIIRHGQIELTNVPTDPRDLVKIAHDAGWEGVVWHHPDGRTAKLKARDYEWEA